MALELEQGVLLSCPAHPRSRDRMVDQFVLVGGWGPRIHHHPERYLAPLSREIYFLVWRQFHFLFLFIFYLVYFLNEGYSPQGQKIAGYRVGALATWPEAWLTKQISGNQNQGSFKNIVSSRFEQIRLSVVLLKSGMPKKRSKQNNMEWNPKSAFRVKHNAGSPCSCERASGPEEAASGLCSGRNVPRRSHVS